MADDLLQRSVCAAEQTFSGWKSYSSVVRSAWLEFCLFQETSQPFANSGIILSNTIVQTMPEHWYWLPSDSMNLISELPIGECIILSDAKLELELHQLITVPETCSVLILPESELDNFMSCFQK